MRRSGPMVLVLGPLAVVGADGVSVDVTGHAGRLLVELVGHGPHVSRDRLLDALWPDERPKSADAALRVHISRLRKLLETAGVSVARRADGLELVGAATDLDRVDELVSRARRGRAEASGLDDLRSAAALVDEARALWRGDPFAPYTDDVGEASLRLLAADVARQREELDDLAADLALDLGRHGEVLSSLERAVAARPFDERCWARLALALYRSGRQREALATFERARRVLLEELGVEPGVELSQLQHDILEHHPRAQWQPPRGRRSTGGPETKADMPADDAGALVGRTGEVARVLGALAGARVVTITGPPGMGKSRVLAAARSLWSDAEPTFLLDAETVPDAQLLELGLADAVGVHLDPGADVDLLDVVAGKLAAGPTLLAIDGGEHLDPGVADLVAGLLARGDGQLRVLVGHRQPLGLDAEEVVPLELLNAEDARAVLRDRLPVAAASAPSGPTEVALDRIVAGVEGHPLSLELVAGWIEVLGADAVVAQLEAGVLPLATEGVRSIAERVEISLGLVDDTTREAFLCLGVFQAEFDAEAVAAVAGTSARAASTILRELARSSLIQSGTRPGWWRLLAGVRDAARTLAERAGSQDTARAAHLDWLRSRAAPYGPAAYGLDVPGVIAALTPWQPDLRAAFERAVDDADLTVAGELYQSMYWLWSAAGQEQEAIRAGERLRPLCDADPRHPLSARLRAGHCLVGGTFAWQARHLDDAEVALRWAEEGDDAFARFAARAAVALGAGWSGDLDRASEMVSLLRAEPLSRASYPFQSVLALEYEGVLRIGQGRFAEARAVYEQVREDYEAIGSLIGEAKAFRYLGWIAGFEGDVERAEACHRVTAARCEAAGDEHGVLHARIGLATIHASGGRWAEAVAGLLELVPALLARGDLGCAAECLCGLAEATEALGAPVSPGVGAESLFADAASLAARVTDRGILLRALLGLAEVAVADDRADVAAELVGALDAAPPTGGRPPRAADTERLDHLRDALDVALEPEARVAASTAGALVGAGALVARIRADLVLRDAGSLAAVSILTGRHPAEARGTTPAAPDEGAPGGHPPRPPGASRRRAG